MAVGKPLVTVKLWSLFQDKAVRDGLVEPIIREALVDTGATHVMLPQAVAESLALPEAGTRRVRYADGRTAVRRLVRGLVMEVEGRTTDCQAVVEPGAVQVLIGQTALEGLDLYVDCQGRCLVPRPESPDMPMVEA